MMPPCYDNLYNIHFSMLLILQSLLNIVNISVIIRDRRHLLSLLDTANISVITQYRRHFWQYSIPLTF